MTRNLTQSWPQYDTARTLDSAPQLALGPLPALAECAHAEGHDNERADGYVLEIRIHLEHVQRVGDDPGEEHAEERADNLAPPARHRCAADDHGANGLQLDPASGGGLGRADAGQK